jgi:hypothetical protein
VSSRTSARDPWRPSHAVVLTGATIWAILLYHFVHGFCGRLPDNDIKGLGCHDEAHRLINE